MSTSFKNCTHVVKTRLLERTLSYKSIAKEARDLFPDARTTDKSVASIARDMRKAGLLEKRVSGPVAPEEPVVRDLIHRDRHHGLGDTFNVDICQMDINTQEDP